MSTRPSVLVEPPRLALRDLRKLWPCVGLLAGLLGASGSAQAFFMQPASMCRVQGEQSPASIYVGSAGVQNISNRPVDVVCPVLRTTFPPAGGSYSVWVDGYSGDGPVSCLLWVVDIRGQYQTYRSFSVSTIRTKFSRLLSIPAAEMVSFSTLTVLCSLAVNAAIYDLEPVQ